MVVFSALLFATTGTAQALADVGASPTAVGAARILVGGALLAVVEGVAGRQRGEPANRSAPDAASRHRVPAGLLVALGAVGVVMYQRCFFAGTQANGVAIGTVLALGSAPVATGALAALAGQGRPDRRWLLATTVAVVGLTLLSGAVGGERAAVDVSGVLLSLGAGVSYAVYTLTAKALLDRGWASTTTMAWLFGGAAVLSVPVLLLAGTAWLWTARGLALALWLGVATTAVAYLLFGRGLAGLPARTVSTLTLAEPCAATLLGLVVLGEHLDPTDVAGLACIAAALSLIATAPAAPVPPVDPAPINPVPINPARAAGRRPRRNESRR